MLKSSMKPAGTAAGMQARLGGWLARVPISANAWTVLSLIPAIAGMLVLGLLPTEPGLAADIFYAQFAFTGLTIDGQVLLAALLFALAFALDAVDGAVARARGEVTAKGAFLDGIVDRLVEFCLLVGVLLYAPPSLMVGSVFVSGNWSVLATLFFGTCLTSFVKAYAEHQGVLSHEQARKLPGLLERGERVGLLFLFLLLVAGGAVGLAAGLLAAVAALSILTFFQRVWLVWRA